MDSFHGKIRRKVRKSATYSLEVVWRGTEKICKTMNISTVNPNKSLITVIKIPNEATILAVYLF